MFGLSELRQQLKQNAYCLALYASLGFLKPYNNSIYPLTLNLAQILRPYHLQMLIGLTL